MVAYTTRAGSELGLACGRTFDELDVTVESGIEVASVRLDADSGTGVLASWVTPFLKRTMSLPLI